MTQSERLAKRVAELFSCSRREAQAYIEGGFITLDGVLCDEVGARVLPEQSIVLLPGAHCEPMPDVSLLWHKPVGITAPLGIVHKEDSLLECFQTENLLQDVGGAQKLRRHFNKLEVCSSMDAAASGLVVLTQNWHIARKLRDDGLSIEQEWVLEVAGLIEPELRAEYLVQLLQANAGLNRPFSGLKLSWQNEIRLRCVYKGGLRGEYDEQMQALFAKLNWRLQASRRIRIGRIALAGMNAGSWRYLRDFERF